MVFTFGLGWTITLWRKTGGEARHIGWLSCLEGLEQLVSAGRAGFTKVLVHFLHTPDLVRAGITEGMADLFVFFLCPNNGPFVTGLLAALQEPTARFANLFCEAADLLGLFRFGLGGLVASDMTCNDHSESGIAFVLEMNKTSATKNIQWAGGFDDCVNHTVLVCLCVFVFVVLSVGVLRAGGQSVLQ